MEHKIGEIFEYNGEWCQCLEEKTCTCFGCDFRDHNCDDISLKEVKGSCQSERRKDNKSVIFKKLKKVGEPYMLEDKKFQKYKVFKTPYIYHKIDYSWQSFADPYCISLEIKQTKEDMGDNDDIRPYDELFSPGTVSNTKYLAKEDMEEKKLNLKPFDLQRAKEGKQVCTRDGRKARIICFDRINGDYYKIVACVTDFDGDFEEVLFYGIDGYIVDSQNPKDQDLMMLPEKKEGWVNIVRESNGSPHMGRGIFQSKEEAKNAIKAFSDNLIDTVKIKWEE